MPGVGSGPISITFTPEATKPASRADSNMYPERRVSLPMSTVPPSGTSTRPAALARFSAKSTVIGCSPTLPRTPSVPKYFRVKQRALLLRVRNPKLRVRGLQRRAALHCAHHLERIDGCRHVVDT